MACLRDDAARVLFLPLVRLGVGLCCPEFSQCPFGLLQQPTGILSNPANALTIVSENLVDLEGAPSAQVQMRWVEPGKPVQSQALLITREENVFIRINNASYM